MPAASSQGGLRGIAGESHLGCHWATLSCPTHVLANRSPLFVPRKPTRAKQVVQVNTPKSRAATTRQVHEPAPAVNTQVPPLQRESSLRLLGFLPLPMRRKQVSQVKTKVKPLMLVVPPVTPVARSRFRLPPPIPAQLAGLRRGVGLPARLQVSGPEAWGASLQWKCPLRGKRTR